MFLMRSQYRQEPFIKYYKSPLLSLLKLITIFSFPVKYATFVQSSLLYRMKKD
jgi:hypothetical protein